MNEKNENQLEEKTNEEKLLEEISNLKEQKMILLAKIENERKSNLRDIEEFKRNANKRLLIKILPLMENYERALKFKVSKINKETNKFISGFNMIFEEFKSILKREGVIEYLPEVKKDIWDSNFCEVIDEIEDDNYELGTVMNVLQKGYILNGIVLVTSKVIVSKRSANVV